MSYYNKKQKRGNSTAMFVVCLGLGMIVAMVFTL